MVASADGHEEKRSDVSLLPGSVPRRPDFAVPRPEAAILRVQLNCAKRRHHCGGASGLLHTADGPRREGGEGDARNHHPALHVRPPHDGIGRDAGHLGYSPADWLESCVAFVLMLHVS